MTSPSEDRLFGANSSMAIKVPCRVATSGPITLSGLQTVDGVTVVANDRVLVKDQADGTENGIYLASTSSWQRAPDFNGARDVSEGTMVKVNSGSTQAGFWYVITTGTITPGTTSITFGAATAVFAVISSFWQAVLQLTTAAASRAALSVYSIAESVAAFVAAGPATTSGLTMSTNRILGRTTASTGAVEEISVGTGLALSGGALSASAASDSAAGIIEIAIQSEMEAASSNTLAVTPGRMRFHPGVCKGWINADGSSAAANASYNVSGTTDTGTGLIWVSWDTDFSSADHVTVVTMNTPNVLVPTTNVLQTTIDVIHAYNTAGTPIDPVEYCIAAFGDFA